MKKLIVGAVCVVVIAGSVYLAWPRRGTVTPRMMHQPRVCEACGEQHGGPTEPIVTQCPKCGKRASVRARSFVCRKCGESFEAYRERLADESLTEVDPDRPPVLVYKLPGGEWKRSVRALGPLKCPKCGSTDVGAPMPK